MQLAHKNVYQTRNGLAYGYSYEGLPVRLPPAALKAEPLLLLLVLGLTAWRLRCLDTIFDSLDDLLAR